jgi:peptidoglycan/LPS O-acetylase OafA/YrhL
MAFMLVFFHHFNTYPVLYVAQYIGWVGVQLFFLLSGFLLTKLLVIEYNQNNTINLKKYFIRRILRIWPLYFLYLLLIAILSYTCFSHPFSFNRLAANVFFYDNILKATASSNNNFATEHLWSISLEEQYYLLLPFLVPWLVTQKRRKLNRVLLFIVGLLFILRGLVSILNLNYNFNYVLPFSADSFLAGIILGLGVYDYWIKRINPVIAFISGSGLLLLLYFMPPRKTMGINQISIYFIPAVAFSLIFISVVYTKGLFYSFFSNKIIRYFGKISFGLYIFHIIAYEIVSRIYFLLSIKENRLLFPLTFLVTVLLAFLSFELIEKHFLKIKAKASVI